MKPILPGNDLCIRCHNGGFTNAPVINPAEHGHHKLNDKGGECIGCHMPATVYMQHQPRHDHGFTIPDPLLTKQSNIPNACNRCHVDQTVDWALQYTGQWYGTNMNRHTRERAQWIAAAEKGETSAKANLVSMLTSGKESPYWRAVAVSFLWQWAAESEVKAVLLERLKDEHPLVRENAVRSLESPLESDTQEIAAALATMLNDPVRNVRVATAWVLRRTMDMQTQAGRELQRAIDYDSDQPTGQYKEGMFLLSRRQPEKALEHFSKAVEWDPFSPPFRSQVAEVLSELGRYGEAARHLEVSCQVKPESAELQVKLGLAWAAAKNFEKASKAANRALEIQPDFEPAKQLLEKLSTAGR
jgi:tetratricopeptide (TPR) repeat protein